MNIESGNYILDATNSSLGWKAAFKVGASHSGTIAIKNGNLNINSNTQVASGEFIIDMTNISEGSLSDEESKGKLIGHLMSDDFFSVEKFPIATLKIKEIDDKNQVTADLTIKGITNEIQFPATITVVNDKLTAEASFEIDRSLWDIRYGSGKFFKDLGDKLIKDEIDISLKIQATKQSIR